MKIHLTKSERDVVRWLFLTNKEIAECIYRSPRTVEKIISDLMSKFDAQTRTELAIKVMRQGAHVDESVYDSRERRSRTRTPLRVLPGGKI